MAHARGQFCSGLSHIAVLLCAALAMGAGAVFVFSTPGLRGRLASFAVAPVRVTVSRATPSGTAALKPTAVGAAPLLARIFNVPAPEQSGGVVFDANIPESDVTPFAPLRSDGALDTVEPMVSLRPVRTVLISEVSIADGSSVRHEFVELYNPTDAAIDLADWELRKKTQSGADSVLVSGKKFSGTIRASGYFLIAHPEYAQSVGADLSWSGTGYGLSENGTVYLLDDQGMTVDLVGYGQCFQSERAPAENPNGGASIARFAPTDTQNNAADFALAVASPRSSNAGFGFATPVRFVPDQSPAVSLFPTPTRSIVPPTPTLAASAAPIPSQTAPPPSSPVPTPSPASEQSPIPSPSPTLSGIVAHPVIMQVQFGIDGNTNADFVQMQNASPDELDLTDYKLVKKTASSGVEYSLKSWKNDRQIIAPGAQFWWVGSS